MKVGSIIAAQTTAQRIDHQHEKTSLSHSTTIPLSLWNISSYQPLFSLSCSNLDPWASPFRCLCFQCLFGFCAPALMTKLWLDVRIAVLSSAQRCSTLSSLTQRAPLPLLGPLLKSRVAMCPHGNHCVPYRGKVHSQTERDRNNIKPYLNPSSVYSFSMYMSFLRLWRVILVMLTVFVTC